jgi:hypothetical protein
MLNLTQAIWGQLSGSSLETAIGGRMYKGQAPDGTEYPYVVYQVVTNTPDHTFSEDFENTIIQFSLFSSASGTTEIEGMYSNLKTLYDEQPFSVTGSTLIWMKRTNAAFIVDEHTTPSGTQRVFAYHVDFETLTSLD